MNIKSDIHCQLKYSCKFAFPESILFQIQRKKETHDDYPGEFYVEEYDSCENLIKRLKILYDEVIKQYECKNIDIHSEKCGFPQYVICNRYGDYRPVGISPYGWDISLYFCSYLLKYFENIYGKEVGHKKYYELTLKKDVFFYLHYSLEPSVVPARELVSEDMARIILKEFLDNGTLEDEIDSHVYYREIEGKIIK